MMKRYNGACALSVLALVGVVVSHTAQAAESATSVYLLGSKGSMAGVTPPPGVYVSDASYYYSGSASGTAAEGVTLRKTGIRDNAGIRLDLEANIKVDGKAYYGAFPARQAQWGS